MDIASIVFWTVVAGLVFYIISIYNHPLRLKHNVSKACSNIGMYSRPMLFNMGLTMAGLIYVCFTAIRRLHFVDATPTPNIRSAAQGPAELKGLAEWMKGDSFMSPFSNSRGVCYHCTLEKHGKRGWRSRWTKLSDERSTPIFQLLDDTGWCIIDPDHAHIIGETERTWPGRDTDCRRQAPTKKNTAYAATAGILLIFSVLVLLTSMRSPFSI